jgi:ethanolamine utilization microcompartment shell protein EutL
MAGASGPGQISGTEVQGRLGAIARNLNVAITAVEDGAAFLAANDDATLNSFYAITAGDAAVLRSAFTDMSLLLQVYRGAATVTPVKDFRVFLARIYGLGF